MPSGIPPTYSEVIARAIESRLGDLYTAMPGRVESYDRATQTASVTPQVRRTLPTTDEDIYINEDLPVIPNVPVLFPRGGGFSITFDLVKGDYVQLVFQMFSTAQWRQTGEVSDPEDVRLHSPGSAFAIPGIAPNAGALAGSKIVAGALCINGPEIRISDDATEYAAMGAAVKAWIEAIRDTSSCAAAPGPVIFTPPSPPYGDTASLVATQVKIK